MEKLNCWEYKKCGRESGGKNAHLLGVCPASTLSLANGFLEGVNGGRACVYVTGTFCSGTIQCTFKDKEKECLDCDFYKYLRSGGTNFSVLTFKKFVDNKEISPDILSSEKHHIAEILKAN